MKNIFKHIYVFKWKYIFLPFHTLRHYFNLKCEKLELTWLSHLNKMYSLVFLIPF